MMTAMVMTGATLAKCIAGLTAFVLIGGGLLAGGIALVVGLAVAACAVGFAILAGLAGLALGGFVIAVVVAVVFCPLLLPLFLIYVLIRALRRRPAS